MKQWTIHDGGQESDEGKARKRHCRRRPRCRKTEGNTTRSNTGAEKNTKTRCLVINNRSSGMGVVKVAVVSRSLKWRLAAWIRLHFVPLACNTPSKNWFPDVSRGAEKNKLLLNLPICEIQEMTRFPLTHF